MVALELFSLSLATRSFIEELLFFQKDGIHDPYRGVHHWEKALADGFGG
jgi:hypothetical protein